MKEAQSRYLTEKSNDAEKLKTEAILSREEMADVIKVFSLLRKWRDEATNPLASNEKSPGDQ